MLVPRRRAESGICWFALLPPAVALEIFAILPADARARATLVCRAWRDFLAEPTAWARLDLSPASGVTVAITDAVLRGAVARALFQVAVMVLDGCDGISPEAFLEVAAYNAGTLRELTFVFEGNSHFWNFTQAVQLAQAAPQLHVFRVDACVSVAAATRMLRNEAPFGALQLRDLEIQDGEGEHAAEADVLALVAAVPQHASLRQIRFVGVRSVRTPAALDALATTVTAVALQSLWFVRCDLSPASAPALVRMLRDGALTTLWLNNDSQYLLHSPAAVQLADAIAANHTLLNLGFVDMLFWHNAAAAAAVMRAVTGHPSLQRFNLGGNDPPDLAVAAVALGALVAKTRLRCTSCAFSIHRCWAMRGCARCSTRWRTTHTCNRCTAPTWA